MNDKFRNSEEMLSAYHDGELTSAEEKQVEAYLRESAEDGQQLRSFEQMGELLRSWSHHESRAADAGAESAELWARIDAQIEASEKSGLGAGLMQAIAALRERLSGDGLNLSPYQFGGVVAVAMLFAFYAGVMSNGGSSQSISGPGSVQLAANGAGAGLARDLKEMQRSPGHSFDSPNQFVSGSFGQGSFGQGNFGQGNFGQGEPAWQEGVSAPTLMSRLPGTSGQDQLISGSAISGSASRNQDLRQRAGNPDATVSFVSGQNSGFSTRSSRVGMPIGQRSFRRTLPLYMSTEQLLSQDAVPGGFRVGRFDFEWIETPGSFEILSQGDERVAPIIWVRSK